MSLISIDHVTKSFGNVEVLRDFSAEFRDGEFITLLGPSGCGKTTILRIIAGFEKPSSGEVRIDGRTVSSPGVFVPPEERGIGMVFQSYAVWPHMNVFNNVAYPLRIRNTPQAELRRRVEEILEAVHLDGYAERMPAQLSGGQQQRVALGRALVAESKLLLLDEPLSNLDAKLRESMRYEIKEIQKKLGITVVFVTHDRLEAMTMSDRVFILNGGVIQQTGSPIDIYRHPVNPFVANFMGEVNFLRGKAGGGKITLADTDCSLPYSGPLSGDVVVAIRPENLRLTAEGRLRGKLTAMFYLGEASDCRVDAGGASLRVSAEAGTWDRLRIGDTVGLDFESFLAYPAEEALP
ncbi:MAG: ABC transporter ATP-binding protein [Oscillospiraceae bacterium]|nr:ABC transporter ATP-binding protein [Oscillospiraceae bacterium]